MLKSLAEAKMKQIQDIDSVLVRTGFLSSALKDLLLKNYAIKEDSCDDRIFYVMNHGSVSQILTTETIV